MDRVFLRYALVGIANTIVYGCLVWLFLHLDYFPRFISVALSFLIAMTFQYTANRIFTFKSKKKKSGEIGKYLVSALFNYALTLAVVWICMDILSLSESITAIFSAGIVAVSGYFLSLLWVYR